MGGTHVGRERRRAGQGLHLPLHHHRPTRRPTGRAARRLHGEQPQGCAAAALLIVDDNATNRRILVLQTQSWGMLPRDAATPPQALEWLRRGDPFDLAILDMHMPEMDGLTLAREIRELQAARPGSATCRWCCSPRLGGRETARGSQDFTAYPDQTARASPPCSMP